jgi:hypothetical protein
MRFDEIICCGVAELRSACYIGRHGVAELRSACYIGYDENRKRPRQAGTASGLGVRRMAYSPIASAMSANTVDGTPVAGGP